MRKTILAALICALLLGMLATAGCRRVRLEEVDGAKGTKTETVQVGDAKRAEVELLMGAGELDVRSDAATGTALKADFDYRPASWEPTFESDVTSDGVLVRIEQAELHGMNLGTNASNRWDIALGAGLPTDLSVKLGAGDAKLNLGGSRVENLDVEMGAGECTLDLSGDWTADMQANIEAGVGAMTIIVPEGVGVRVNRVEEGLGDTNVDGLRSENGAWVNDAYDSSPVTIEIEIRQGIGEINIRTAS